MRERACSHRVICYCFDQSTWADQYILLGCLIVVVQAASGGLVERVPVNANWTLAGPPPLKVGSQYIALWDRL